jgi:hypothetical protein
VGRPKLDAECITEGCTARAVSRERCRPCYDRWRYKRGHLRCRWPGCKAHQDDGAGRRMGSGRDKLWYCQAHEVEHLRSSPDIERMNLERLGKDLRAEGECWIWTGAYDSGLKRPLFDPEGANLARWITYRVVWDMLTGGHRHGLELDHCMCGNPRCCSPAHLEPVTRPENERRKRNPKHQVNWVAAEMPAVVAFAQQFNLPLPIAAP